MLALPGLKCKDIPVVDQVKYDALPSGVVCICRVLMGDRWIAFAGSSVRKDNLLIQVSAFPLDNTLLIVPNIE